MKLAWCKRGVYIIPFKGSRHTVIRFFSSSKFSCKKFSRKIIFVPIELNEKNFTSRVYCIIIFVSKNFRAFSADKNIFTTKKANYGKYMLM